MVKIEGHCGPMDAVKTGVDIWKVVCPHRYGVTVYTRALDEKELVESVCGPCSKGKEAKQDGD